MNCVELQQSLAEMEENANFARNTHLAACPECSALVQELNLIVAAAGHLQATDEPSPRVWNSIEIALRQEGLIRPQTSRTPLASSFGARWGGSRWLVPLAAMVLLTVGIYLRHQSPAASPQQAALAVPEYNSLDLNDDDLMQEVQANAPAMTSEYKENLRRVNESIHDAQGVVDQSPNDEDARRSLMDAYQQKSMLFEMAMDRSLP